MKKNIYSLLTVLLLITISMSNNLSNLNAKENFSAEQLNSLHRLSDIQVSPDGKWILYSLSTPNIEENRSYRDLHLISIDGKEKKQLTSSPENEYDAVWFPDGKHILYIVRKNEKSNIIKLNIDTKQEETLYSDEQSLSNLKVSPDKKYLSFTKDIKLRQASADIYPDLAKAKVRMYSKLPVRHWDHWLDVTNSHLFIYNIENKSLKDLIEGEQYDVPVPPFGGKEQICWSPDSKEIAYTSKKVFDIAESTNNDVFVYSVQDGSTKNISSQMFGADFAPLYSPDGKWIAFLSQRRAGFESDRIRLMLYDRKTENISELSSSLDQWVGQVVWAPDSKSIYLSAEDGPVVQVYQMELPSGKWKVISEGRVNYDGELNISPDGKTIVVGRRDMMHPTDIYSFPAKGGAATQLTNVNEETYKNLKPIEIRERWIQSRDRKKVHCWVIYPPDFDSTKKYPMLTYCQGGPQSTISQYFSFRWNFYLMASQGYVVLAPNRRGMPGFGQDWCDAITGDWGGLPMQDILYATDEMLKEPYIDKSKVAAVGASAGGYAVFWLAGNHEKRFSALIAHSGVFNMISKYGSTEELWFPNWEYGGPYWENDEFYNKNSPHKFADNWDTPILIITGENDFRVPYSQALEAFTVAQLKRIPSKLITFPEENHWILKPQNAVLWQREFYDFLKKYCLKEK
ncbi:MAG: S9 family peptidase [Ignavibacteria bacterium]|nr:S9 family peptidase [Ignavibacteria bacterium]